MARTDGDSEAAIASGVDALIARLRDEGVAAGRKTGEAIVAEARAEAEAIRKKALVDAQAAREAARGEAEAFRAAGEAALRNAFRDAVLDLKGGLSRQFGEEVARLVSERMSDPEILGRMILAVAGRAADDAGLADADAMEVVLPRHAIGIEDLRNNPDAMAQGPLTAFVRGVTADMLRDGVRLAAGDSHGAGLHVRVADGGVELDLDDKAVAALLLRHLQPRFRAILEGVVG